jgi:hypothetical protein
MSGMSSHTSTAPPTSDWTELAVRESDGLEVALQWSASADAVKVTVRDQRLEDAFDLHVDGADALRAFHHPFAFAGDEDLRFRVAARTDELQPKS